MRATAAMLVLIAAACGSGEITSGTSEAAWLDGGDPGHSADDGSSPDGGTTAGDPDASGAAWEAELSFCIEETNRYRAEASRAALTRSAALEAYAADGARIDQQSGEPHKHFLDTDGGGIAFAENEIPAWPVSMFGSVHNVIAEGLSMMMNEGEGGPHHDAILGSYTKLGCGVYREGDVVTVVQDFQ